MEPLGYYVPTKGKCSNLSNVNFYGVKMLQFFPLCNQLCDNASLHLICTTTVFKQKGGIKGTFILSFLIQGKSRNLCSSIVIEAKDQRLEIENEPLPLPSILKVHLHPLPNISIMDNDSEIVEDIDPLYSRRQNALEILEGLYPWNAFRILISTPLKLFNAVIRLELGRLNFDSITF